MGLHSGRIDVIPAVNFFCRKFSVGQTAFQTVLLPVFSDFIRISFNFYMIRYFQKPVVSAFIDIFFGYLSAIKIY